MICLLLQVMTSYQESNKGTGIGVLSETLHYTTVVTSKMSMFLKHKLVK